jgi:hypothetical protein
LDTLEDFRTEKYFPTKKLTGTLFEYFLTEAFSTIELNQFLSLYRFYIETHGSKVFASLWKPTKTIQPFWKNVQIIWNRRDAALESNDFERTLQYELLMEFLLLIVRSDIEHGMVDRALMNYCGVEDINNWFPELNDAFRKFHARIDKKCIDFVPEWISLV